MVEKDTWGGKFNTQGKKANEEWVKTIIQGGTISDKVAALTLSIQKSPLYSFKALDSLMKIVEKKGRRESLLALTAAKDLYLNDLLPDRHLVSFNVRPLSHPGVTPHHLVAWYFEDLIKTRYAQLIARIEDGLKDTILNFREKSLKFVFDLLTSKPEEEHTLLALLVNKLGDSEKRLASNTAFYLTKLLEQHSNMKLVVVREIETFIHRPNLSDRAQYYSILFLNQIILSKHDEVVAEKLLVTYFSLFNKAIGYNPKILGTLAEKEDEIKRETKREKKKLRELNKKNKKKSPEEELEGKLLSALLTGVSRAFPFSSKNLDRYQKYFELLYKIVELSSFGKATQALQLLWQVLGTKETIPDRFYTALYDKLSHSQLFIGRYNSLFLNLLYKAVRDDPKLDRSCALIKRILQIAYYYKSNVAAALLLIVSELLKDRPELKVLISHPEEIDEATLANSKQIVASFEPTEPHKPKKENPMDSLKVPSLEGKGEEDEESGEEKPPQETAAVASLKEVSVGNLAKYNWWRKNPLEANAQLSCFWELSLLCQHEHPSVAKWAKVLAQNQLIHYSGDPLRDFDLMGFFDRFSFKRPKKDATEPKTQSQLASQYIPYYQRAAPVNTEYFQSKPEDKIRQDEMFFYKYFKQDKVLNSKQTIKKKRNPEDDDDIDSDEADAAIEREVSGYSKADFWDKPSEYDYEAIKPEDIADDVVSGDSYEGEDDEEDDFDSREDEGEEDEEEDLGVDPDDEEEEDGPAVPTFAKGKEDFAELEEFSHMLEESGTGEEKEEGADKKKRKRAPSKKPKRPIKKVKK
eukprot:TRINITY_DN26761_c0_g1_i1.p1 TRINITY_DN26761_c0_g1~~TRINITY_DN26761_c0_g1_i1.p1  ORF type:complete len:880 (-),score=291.92 TRINITY_DN26761_c0_g1_i1:6-2423(-)